MDDSPDGKGLLLPAEIVAAYRLEGASFQPVTIGHINRTYRVEKGDQASILQRLNPIFSADCHYDIDVITDHLASHSLITPRLIKTTERKLWAEDQEGGVWRLQTCIEGHTHARVESKKMAFEAGDLLGQFHRALSDLRYDFRATRLGVHDTPKHRQNLLSTIDAHPNHPAFETVQKLADELLERLDRLAPFGDSAIRIVHGDPKVSNIMFSKDGRALCFVDLDTLAPMATTLELGDAFRSWCCVGGEESADTSFSMDFFEAAITGYRTPMAPILTADEIESLVAATELIALELSMRFCADALAESYFGWDHSSYEAAWQHNLVRTKSQLSFARSLGKQKGQAEQIVKNAFF